MGEHAGLCTLGFLNLKLEGMDDILNKTFKLIFIILLVLQLALAVETYDQVRIWSEDTGATIIQLLEAGIDPEGMNVRPDIYIDVIVDSREKAFILDQGMMSEDIILNLSEYYASRLEQTGTRELGFGSMGGYLTFIEIVSYMDSLHSRYPDIVSSKISIGQSHEGRDIWAFKISDSPGSEDGDPEVLYNSLIHAREPAAMMTLMYFVTELVEKYNQDPVMTYLVNHREMWFIPVINPDGYVYNEFTNPNGGGMHRKNRRPGCTSSPGVDLNRNWGFQWGYNDIGSSPDSCSATYRGYSEFSEPETQAVRDFVLNHDFQLVFNYHSYGNLLIKPWGYDSSQELPIADNMIYDELGWELVSDNDYLYGTGAETVGYEVNGDAVDYMYGDLGVINFTPEVGTWEQGGFWPSPDVIFNLAENNLSMNVHLAGCAGSWVVIEAFALEEVDVLEMNDILSGELTVRNKGVGVAGENVILRMLSPDSSIIPSISEIDVSGLASQASLDFGNDDFSFQIAAGSGELATLMLSIEVQGEIAQIDTFTWNVGRPDTVFIDDFEHDLEQWTSDSWGSTTSAFEGNLSMTDSPFGDYTPLSTTMVTLNQPVDLRGYPYPEWSFDARWDIEIYYDFCQVLASLDNGDTWIPLEGNYTVPGNGSTVQPQGEPGYHGLQGWTHETISLEQFSSVESLLLGFKLMSDNFYEGDGFSVDNLLILGWGTGFLHGDLNRDGEITITDAVLLLDSILEGDILEGELLELSDLNQDTLINVSDLVSLIELILN